MDEQEEQQGNGHADSSALDPTDTLILAFMRLAQLSRKWETFAGRDMSKTQIAILWRLRRDGTSRLTTVAEHLKVELSIASRQVNALVEAGAVVRHRDPADGRAWLITLTDTGRERLRAVERERREWFDQVLAGYSDDERAVAARVASAINAEWERSSSFRAKSTRPLAE